MFLAQYFDDPEYANMADMLRCQGAFMILDNGVAEGVDLPWDRVAYIAREFKFDEVILPDVLKRSVPTINSIRDAIRGRAIYPINRMLVPQGASWTEWNQCLDFMIHNFEFSTIGIPKHLGDLYGGRRKAIDTAFSYSKGRHHIHLLGLHHNPAVEIGELKQAQYWNEVRSLDSAAPLAWAQRGESLLDTSITHLPLEWKREAKLEDVWHNLSVMDRLCL